MDAFVECMYDGWLVLNSSPNISKSSLRVEESNGRYIPELKKTGSRKGVTDDVLDELGGLAELCNVKSHRLDFVAAVLLLLASNNDYQLSVMKPSSR